MKGLTKLLRVLQRKCVRNKSKLTPRLARRFGKQVDRDFTAFLRTGISTVRIQHALDFLQSRQWMLVGTQLYVHNSKTCTFIDLVARDAVNDIHLIEVKTGYHSRQLHTKLLFENNVNCIETVHKMQAYIGKELYIHQFGETNGKVRAHVLYIREKSVEIVEDVHFTALHDTVSY
jgi:hypothetical protein